MVENALDSSLSLPDLLEQLALADNTLRVCAQTLADTVPLDDASWQAVAQARSERDAAIAVIGPAIVHWMHSGGRITLHHPETVSPDEDSFFDEVVPADDSDEVVHTPDEPELPHTEAPTDPVVTDHSKLAAFVRGGGFFSTQTQIPDLVLPTSELERLGAPGGLAEAHDAHAEIGRLRALASEAQGWSVYRKDDRTALLSAITARARALQDADRSWLGNTLGPDALQSLFQQLSRVSREGDFNFVKGLKLDATTPSDGWLAEAGRRWRALERCCGTGDPSWRAGLVEVFLAAFDRGLEEECLVAWAKMLVTLGVNPNEEALRQRLEAHLGVFESHGALKTWRTRLREERRRADSKERSKDVKNPQTAPPHIWARTVGRRAVVVGGDQRGEAQARLKAFFGFESVEWETGTRLRRVAALAGRAQDGHIDVAIVLRRFISHKLTDILQPALKRSGTDTVWVPHGYGVTAVLNEMQRILSPSGEE